MAENLWNLVWREEDKAEGGKISISKLNNTETEVSSLEGSECLKQAPEPNIREVHS